MIKKSEVQKTAMKEVMDKECIDDDRGRQENVSKTQPSQSDSASEGLTKGLTEGLTEGLAEGLTAGLTNTVPEEIPDVIRYRILMMLDKIEREHSIHVLFAVESGSRAWGMASSDSDYDVRGIYVPRDPERANLERYLSGHPPTEITVFSEDRMIDISLWDIRKGAKLLTEGKVVMHQWACSPILYIHDAVWPRVITALAAKNSTAISVDIVRHYVGMFRSALHSHLSNLSDLSNPSDPSSSSDLSDRTDRSEHSEHSEHSGLSEHPKSSNNVTPKKYMYAILPALYIEWMRQYRFWWPPIRIQDVLADVVLPLGVKDAIGRVVASKMCSTEKNVVQERVKIIDDWMRSLDNSLKRLLAELCGFKTAFPVESLIRLVRLAERTQPDPLQTEVE